MRNQEAFTRVQLPKIFLILLAIFALVSGNVARAGGTVTVEISSAPSQVTLGQAVNVEVRYKFTGDDNDGPWQVETIAIRDDDGPVYNTIAIANNPRTIPSQGTWYYHTFSNVVLSNWDDGGNGVELYAWVSIDDNDFNSYSPDGSSAIKQVSVVANYNVTLDKQGGLGGTSSVTATYGSPMPSASAPSRTGYTFQGYFTSTGGNGTKYYNANMSSARNWDRKSNTTLYAYWTGTPDLIAYSVSVSDSTVDPGQSITVNWTAKNQGTASAGSTQQGVMWSSDGTITRSDALLDREYLGSMGVNVTSPESHSVTIPSGATPGQTYYIGVYADYDLAVDEGSNEGNNSSSAVAVTINAPDLRVTSMKMAGSTASDPHFEPGQSISLDFQGHNGGNGKSKTNVQMKWYYGTSANAKTTYIDVGYLGTINGLAAGEYEWETDAAWSVPTAPGTYWLTVVIDSDGNNPESSEGNNEATIRFYVDAPDLIVQQVTDTAASYNVGQKINAKVTVRNSGQASADSSKVYYYLGSTGGSSSTGPTTTYQSIQQGSIGSLAVGATQDDIIGNWITGGWTIPEGVAEGTYCIWVKADSSSEVAESNENNNWGCSAEFAITTKPNLLITADPRRGRPGQVIRLTGKVYRDVTPTPLPLAGIPVEVWIAGVKVGETTSIALLPEDTISPNVSIDVTVPSNWSSGQVDWQLVFSGNEDFAPVSSVPSSLIVSVPPWGSESVPWGIEDPLASVTDADGNRRDSVDYRYRYSKFGVVLDQNNAVLSSSVTLNYRELTVLQAGIEDELFLMRSPANPLNSEPERCFSPEGEYVPWVDLDPPTINTANRTLTLQNVEKGWNYHLFRRLHVKPAEMTQRLADLSDSTERVILIVHGWNRTTEQDSFETDLNRLRNEILGWLNDRGMDRWQVVMYNWGVDADTGGSLTSAFPNRKNAETDEIGYAKGVDSWAVQNSTEAAEAGLVHGYALGARLASLPNLEKVQIISHSAGAWVGRGALEVLQRERLDVIAKWTLLDPYMPSNCGAESALGKPLVESFLTIGDLSGFENYYARWEKSDWLGIQDCTRGDFVVGSVPSVQMQLDNLTSNDLYSGHSGPVRFYADSVGGNVVPESHWISWDPANAAWAISLPALEAGVPTPTPSPTVTPTLSPTVTPSPSPTNSLTPTPTVSPSSTVTPTVSPSSSPTETSTPTHTPTPSPSPDATETMSPSTSPSATYTSTPQPTDSPFPSASPTYSPTPVSTGTQTPMPTATVSASPSATPANTPVPSTSPTASSTVAPTATATKTPGITLTVTRTPIPSPTGNPVTLTPTDSPAPTSTPAPSVTATPRPTVPPTLTPSPTPLVPNAPWIVVEAPPTAGEIYAPGGEMWFQVRIPTSGQYEFNFKGNGLAFGVIAVYMTTQSPAPIGSNPQVLPLSLSPGIYAVKVQPYYATAMGRFLISAQCLTGDIDNTSYYVNVLLGREKLWSAGDPSGDAVFDSGDLVHEINRMSNR